MARLLSRLRQFTSFLTSSSLVAAYCRILFWFFRAAEEEKRQGTGSRSEKDKRNVERGSDWALSELGSLLGRQSFNELLPHAKYLGFSIDDVEACLRRREREDKRRVGEGRQKENNLVDSPPLDASTLNRIEDFVIHSFQIFAEEVEGDPSEALTRWLIDNNKDAETANDSRRFVWTHQPA